MTNNKPQENRCFSKIVLFLGSVVCVFIFSAIANYVIDPTGAFFQREPILRPAIAPTVGQVKRVINGDEPGCQDFLIGTSVVLVLDTTSLTQKTCKLVFYGKGIQSYIKGVKTLLDHGVQIDHLIVFISYDHFYNQSRFAYDISYIYGLDYPRGLYETLFYFKTLFFLDLYETAKQLYIPSNDSQFPIWNKDLRKTDLTAFEGLKYRWDISTPFVPWPSQEARNRGIEGLGPSTLVTENRDYEPEAFKALLRELVALSEWHQFDVTFVRPPNFYKNVAATHKQEFFDSYRQILEISPYYDFSYAIQYLRDPALWLDMNHYNKEVAKRIMRDLKNREVSAPDFGKVITKDNIDAHLKTLEEDIYQYFIDVKPYPPNTLIHDTWLKGQ